jgi:hypothetical protein
MNKSMFGVTQSEIQGMLKQLSHLIESHMFMDALYLMNRLSGILIENVQYDNYMNCSPCLFPLQEEDKNGSGDE